MTDYGKIGRNADGTPMVLNKQAQNWDTTHSIDPLTGELVGPPGAPPAGSAQNFQAMHEQAVWARKNRLSQQASNWLQGANGLLQRYRPGGAATMEAGVYSQLAQTDLARSEMLQPMDLLSEFREAQVNKAAREAKQAAREQAVAGIVGPIIGGFAGGGFGATVDPNQGPQAETQGPMRPTDYTSVPGMGEAADAGSYYGATVEKDGAQGGMAQPGQEMAPGGQQGVPGSQKGKGVGPGGQTGGSGTGGAPSASGGVGSNGDFSPQAWSSAAAARSGPMAFGALSYYVANLLESDGSWGAIDSAIDRQLALRLK